MNDLSNSIYTLIQYRPTQTEWDHCDRYSHLIEESYFAIENYQTEDLKYLTSSWGSSMFYETQDEHEESDFHLLINGYKQENYPEDQKVEYQKLYDLISNEAHDKYKLLCADRDRKIADKNAKLKEKMDAIKRKQQAEQEAAEHQTYLQLKAKFETENCNNCNNCWKCLEGKTITASRMILCPICMYKRCPKASDHHLTCTNSNDSNQPGSVYQNA
jgi:hypothetical protein